MTHRERQALDFIRAYQERNGGASPSFDEIREALGLASKSGVARLVRRDPTCARSIVLTDRAPDLSAVSLQQLLAEIASRGVRVEVDTPVHAHHHAVEGARA
jgi:SOS-response transcriptional repressor LexA